MDTLTEIKNLVGEKVQTESQIAYLTKNLSQVKDELKTKMASLVPKDLKGLVENEAIVETLVDHGMISSRISLRDYNIKIKKVAEDALKRLLSAWKGFVESEKMDSPNESHRVYFKFKLK